MAMHPRVRSACTASVLCWIKELQQHDTHHRPNAASEQTSTALAPCQQTQSIHGLIPTPPGSEASSPGRIPNPWPSPNAGSCIACHHDIEARTNLFYNDDQARHEGAPACTRAAARARAGTRGGGAARRRRRSASPPPPCPAGPTLAPRPAARGVYMTHHAQASAHSFKKVRTAAKGPYATLLLVPD